MTTTTRRRWGMRKMNWLFLLLTRKRRQEMGMEMMALAKIAAEEDLENQRRFVREMRKALDGD